MAIADLMVLLHKTEKEILEGVSPAMIVRLAFLEQTREAKRQADERMSKIGQANPLGSNTGRLRPSVHQSGLPVPGQPIGQTVGQP